MKQNKQKCNPGVLSDYHNGFMAIGARGRARYTKTPMCVYLHIQSK